MVAAPLHVPVLRDQVVQLYDPALQASSAVVVDATVGLGGHAQALLSRYPQLTLVGLDRDSSAIRHSAEVLADYRSRLHLIHTSYDHLRDVLRELGYREIDGVLFDLGVSSMQLDQPERGFSYSRDAPLDMRMDPATDLTAEEIVNTYSIDDLIVIFREYGDERFARRIASAIVQVRSREHIGSTAQLTDVVRNAIPAAARRGGGHPAKRIFQALRIEVNAELELLRRALPAAIDMVRVGGRIVVLSYHSGEDRIVKQTFAQRARNTTPLDLPVELPGEQPTLRLLTRGPVTPSDEELISNPRAASVRLRAAERIRERA